MCGTGEGENAIEAMLFGLEALLQVAAASDLSGNTLMRLGSLHQNVVRMHALGLQVLFDTS